MPDADHDTRSDLIQRLLLEAGRLMEDASPEFALAPPGKLEVLEARIASLEAAASDLSDLAAVARTLFRIHSGSS